MSKKNFLIPPSIPFFILFILLLAFILKFFAKLSFWMVFLSSLLIFLSYRSFVKNRIKKIQRERELEKRILHIARGEPHSRINALELALKTELSVHEAEKILEELSQKGYAEMKVSESGQIFYEINSLKNSH